MANTGPFRIVLLFDDQANSLQVVPSLREKGMEVHTVTSANELIQIIAAHKFDLVCLSMNHSSSSSLVQVLKIKTHVAVLVFGEDGETSTTKAILKAAADYQVTGAITSYNIWMKIAHLVKEKQRHNESTSRMLNGKPRVEEESIVVKSSARAKEESIGKVSLVKSKEKEKVSSLISVKTDGGDVPKQMKSSVSVIADESDNKIKAPKKEKKMLVGAKKKAPRIVDSEPQEEIVTVKGAPAEDLGHVNVQAEASAPEKAEVVVKEKPAAKKLMKMGKVGPKAAKESKTSQDIKPVLETKSTLQVKDAEAPKSAGRVMRAIGKPKKQDVVVENLTEDELIDREIDQIQSLFFEGSPEAIGLGGNVNVEDTSSDADHGSVMIFHGEESQSDTVTVKGANDGELGAVHVKGTVPLAKAEHVTSEEDSSYETEADKIVSIEAARAHRKKVRDQKKAEKAAEKKAQAAAPVLPPIDAMSRLKFKKIFREAVVKAGQYGFQKAENTNSIGFVTKMSLIPVDNRSERGFIVMANNVNDYTTIDEASGFKNTLVEEMRSCEEHAFSLGDTYNVETFEVDVAAWAERSSQFFYMFEDPSTGKQVLICFLKKDDLFPETKKMEEHHMHRIELHVLPPRMPVSFDAYLFLARNEKMLPYLRRGGSLTPKQVQRLYKRGFKFLYIKDEDVRDYYSFYFSLYLNQDLRLERKLA